MNERTAVAAEMYAEMGLSESTIAKIEELVTQAEQEIEAEILDDAFSLFSGEPEEVPIDPEDVQAEVPAQYHAQSRKVGTLCNHLFGPTPTRPARLCGSPALRGEAFCYFHHPTRKPIREPNERRARRIARQAFTLPLPTNSREVHRALCWVASLIASNQIDHRRSGQIIFALQTAISNMAKG
jgi:hypothetical protein